MVLPLDQRGPLTGSPTAAATTGILASYVTTARRSAPTAQAVARWPGPWRDGPGRGEMARAVARWPGPWRDGPGRGEMAQAVARWMASRLRSGVPGASAPTSSRTPRSTATWFTPAYGGWTANPCQAHH